MAAFSVGHAKKLIARLGQPIARVLHHDAAAFTLLLDDTRRPHLFAGLEPVPGVVLTTAPFDSVHWADTLVRVPDLAAWLGDARSLDERAMRWNKGAWAEAVRFGRRLLVCEGGNNMRNLSSIGLTFDTESEARRAFTSFATVLPAGWVDTGPVYVAGRGGVSREYLASAAQRERTRQHAAIVRVLDDELRTTIVDPTGNRTEQRQRFATEAEAVSALNAFELQWYLAGGQQYEVESMEGLKRRADRTLVEHVEEELSRVENPAAFVRQVLSDAGLDAVEKVERSHPAHWLRVGERLPAAVEHHEVPGKKHERVHLYLDATHRAVAVIVVDEKRDSSWLKHVERAPTDEKFKALSTKFRRRLKV